jgi:cytochrome c-type biogenesis protein CcmH
VIRQFFYFFIGLLAATTLHAAIDPDQFDNEAERARYQHFIADLRCPKCQNQNLAGSDAPIAADLRKELRRLLKEGQSDQQIVDFMVARYGEFVLYKPRLDRNTALLWFAPIALFGVGAGVIGTMLWRHRRARASATTALTAEEQAQLAQLLQSNGSESDHSSRRHDA